MAYAYHMLGRMLRRAHSVAGTTTFEWDGWNCVREVSPDQVITRWGTPQGELPWFERGGVRYEVHSDTLGSVRLVTGTDGAALARVDHDAWGNPLPSTFDHVPGGMPYRFVGAIGVRWDADTGMHYMRHRWYDPGLGRFISGVPVWFVKRYAYANNSPFRHTDTFGTAPGELCNGAQEAAVAAFKEFGSISINTSTEHGGFLYASAGNRRVRYGHTPAIHPPDGYNVGPPLNRLLGPGRSQFNNKSGRQLYSVVCPAWRKKRPTSCTVASHHTHPYFERLTNDTLSQADLGLYDRMQIPGYLMTSSGLILFAETDARKWGRFFIGSNKNPRVLRVQITIPTPTNTTATPYEGDND